MAMSATTTILASLIEGIPKRRNRSLKGGGKALSGRRWSPMRYVLVNTSVLTLAQWGSEKGRGVFCDNKAKDYRVWRTTLLYYLTSD